MMGGFPGAVRSGGIRQSFTGVETTLSNSIMAGGTKATEWETKQMLWLATKWGSRGLKPQFATGWKPVGRTGWKPVLRGCR